MISFDDIKKRQKKENIKEHISIGSKFLISHTEY